MSQASDDSSVAVLPFHNICPRSRNERKALGDKDSLEKARLAQREGKEWNDNEQARRLNPVKPLRDSLSYATESERFSTDVAAQDAERRSKERDAQKAKMERKRQMYYDRESERWKKMDETFTQDLKYLDSLKNTDKKDELTFTNLHYKLDSINGTIEFIQSKRNTNSVAYDPITLKYNDTEDGKRLLYSDQHVRYRAALRAKFLNDKMCTNDYNIITGGDLTTKTIVPSPPSMT